MKIALTGGIACGKSLLSSYLKELGAELIDADDIVHELIPAHERARLAKIVFNDASVRRKLEERIHPVVKSRIEAFYAAPLRVNSQTPPVRIAVIPLLFESHWDKEYDIICCVKSSREKQIERMIMTRGYTRDEAEARLAAQMPVDEKAAKSHYVIVNNQTPEDLKLKAEEFFKWLHRSNY